jgi:hypothetical protein
MSTPALPEAKTLMYLRDELFVLTLVAGCLTTGCASSDRVSTSSPIGASPPAASSATCDADKARFAIGARASQDLLDRARQAAGASTARFIRPNEKITFAYLDSRLNLALDEQDVVRSVSCG